MMQRVLVKANGITVYLKSSCLVQKAVFHSSPAAILIRLYPFFMYHLVNHFLLLVFSSSSRMSGRGYLLDIVIQFRALLSTQNIRELSFLRTNTIGAVAAEHDRPTFPIGIFSCRYSHRASSSSQVVSWIAPVGIFAFRSGRRIW